MEADTLWLSGRAALREWARWCRERGPSWPTSCTLHRAFYGRGGTIQEMPAHVMPTDAAVARLSPIIRAVVRTFFVETHKHWRDHAKELGLTRRDYEKKLRIGETEIAKMLT